ncbi:hypothetical protein ACFWXG_39145, partial [Streptomyces sp. NPDC059072]
MTDRDLSSAQRSHRHHWRRDVVELAALFCAVAVADGIANLVVHGPRGPVLLVASAVALLVTAAFHTWWARRHSHAPPPDTGPSAAPAPGRGPRALAVPAPPPAPPPPPPPPPAGGWPPPHTH